MRLQNTLWILALIAACTAGPENDNNQPVDEIVESTSVPEGELIYDSGDGVTLYQRPAGNLVGLCSGGGHSISFETVRGIPIPEDRREAEETALEYEIDVRFLDKHGVAFITSVGGHATIDPSWTVAYESSPLMSSPADRAQDFLMARHVAETLKGSDFGVGIDAEIWTLIINGTAVQDEELVLPKEGSDIDLESLPTELYRSGLYTHYVYIYWKWAWGFTPVQHSAIRGYSYSSSGSLVAYIATSNHGTNASDPVMNYKCGNSYGNRGNSYLTTNYESCTTPYGIGSSQHLCNDDTYAQYSDIKANGPGSYSTCGDGWVRGYAPTCY